LTGRAGDEVCSGRVTDSEVEESGWRSSGRTGQRCRHIRTFVHFVYTCCK